MERKRAQLELESTLIKNTGLQEKLAATDSLLVSVSSERRELEQRLSESSAAGLGLERALQRSVDDLALAAVASDNLRDQLKKVSGLGEEVKTLRSAVVEKQASLEEAGRAAEAHRAAMRAEAEHREAAAARLHAVLEDMEADRAAGDRTAAELRQGLADVSGVGAELGEKLVSVVWEKNDARGRLEVAEGALAASAANGRRLHRELCASQEVVMGLREEAEGGRRGLDKLQKVGCGCDEMGWGASSARTTRTCVLKLL